MEVKQEKDELLIVLDDNLEMPSGASSYMAIESLILELSQTSECICLDLSKVDVSHESIMKNVAELYRIALRLKLKFRLTGISERMHSLFWMCGINHQHPLYRGMV